MMRIPRIVRFAQFEWIALNERWLNISTNDRQQYEEGPGCWRGSQTDRALNADNRAYTTPDYYYLYRIVKLLKPGPQDVVYDIGSGMGRILCVMGRQNVKKCVGIELFEEMCAVARENAARLRGRRAAIEIRCEDAARADVGDGTIYFFYNPFGPDTMREALANIKRSLAQRPRRLRLVYYNSVCRDVLEACIWLRRYHSFRTFTGQEVDFFESATYQSP